MTIERIEAVPTLPRRKADGNKGDYGTVLAIAGGRGMAGAAALVGAGALRSGAGRVRVASAAEVQPTVASFEPSYMAHPLPDEDGHVRFPASRKVLERLMEGSDTLAVGPGLGLTDDLKALVRWLVEEVELPAVLDADGLNNLVGQVDALDRLKRPFILTPHPGEFARLVGRTTAEVLADRENQAVTLARRSEHLTVVLKGSGTIVTDGNRLYVNTTGNPGMAKGGSGDVLTGIIAALVGQKLPAFEAAVLGTYVHGLAGDIARDHDGEIGMIAGDIVDALADAFIHLAD